MTHVFSDGLDFLLTLRLYEFVALFWFFLIFETPRYGLICLLLLVPAGRRGASTFDGRVSVIVSGHSEARKIEACVTSLREQSRCPDEIIVVSDGSTDGMAAHIAGLRRRGLIDSAHSTDLRGGKAAGLNLARRWASGDVIVTVDCDCTFHRHAIRNISKLFSDADVDAACGDVRARNWRSTLLAAMQAVEYRLSISLGRQALDRIGQLSCISGAFCAVRAETWRRVSGHDAGGGEDLDLTLRIRRAGGVVRFAADAICRTDLPEGPAALISQRMRWERDAVRLRYRKHGGVISPFSREFSLSEAAHELEHLVFAVGAALAAPVYLVWLFVAYGDLAAPVLVAAHGGVLLFDLFLYLVSAVAAPGRSVGPLLLYLPAYSIVYAPLLRLLRCWAYLQEWVLSASEGDSFTPAKVRLAKTVDG